MGWKFISDSGSPFWSSGVDDIVSLALKQKANVSITIIIKLLKRYGIITQNKITTTDIMLQLE